MSESDIDDFHVHTAFNVYLDHDALAKLGLLSVLWSQIEFCVEMGVYHFKGMTFEEGRNAAVLKRDISKQLEQLKALAGDACGRRDRLTFNALLDRAAVLAGDRNLAIHGHWVRLSDHDGKVAAVSWRYVTVGDELNRLETSLLKGMCIEAGLISQGLFDLLKSNKAFPFMAE